MPNINIYGKDLQIIKVFIKGSVNNQEKEMINMIFGRRSFV